MNKTIKQELVWILIVATFVAGFFLLQGSITSYTILDTSNTPLVDIQIHSNVSISPTLDVTIPTEKLTTITPDSIYSYIQIKPISESFTYVDILFKVSNSFIFNNKLEKENIVLFIFDKEWKQLPTSITKETLDYTEYKSRSEKLGLFAIAKSTKVIHIEEPILIEKPTKPITPILTLAIIILAIVLTIELLSLLKNKLGFILLILAFALMILGLTVQQPITKDILVYGLSPLTTRAFILSIILNIILNRLRKARLYSYIRNIIISILAIFIFTISITTTYTIEIIIYAVLPLILISIIATSIVTLLFHIFRKIIKKSKKKNKKKQKKS